MPKIRGSFIFTNCATKSSVFNYSYSSRSICLLATIWYYSYDKRTRIPSNTGPQVGHARSAAHCLKSVKRLRREKDKKLLAYDSTPVVLHRSPAGVLTRTSTPGCFKLGTPYLELGNHSVLKMTSWLVLKNYIILPEIFLEVQQPLIRFLGGGGGGDSGVTD